MNYKKIIKDNYTLHFIDTDRFKELTIAVHFSNKIVLKNRGYLNLLCRNVTYTSKKYNTKNKMAIVGEELYGTKVTSFAGRDGNVESFVFSLDMLNPKYIEDKNYMEECLDFFKEVIFNPNVEDDHFNDEYFNITKNDYINSLKAIKDNSDAYASKRFSEIYYKGTVLSKSFASVKEVEKITSKSLYDFYKSLFNGNYKIDIVIHGEDIDEYESIIDNMFKDVKGNNKKININIDYKDNKECEVVDSLKYNQSKLYIAYKINNITEHEKRHVLKVYNAILGSMNDSMLFNYVREKYSLCYTIASTFNIYYPTLMIYSGINKNNYEEAKKRIFETMEFMKDKKKVSKLFNQAKETLNTMINSYYDDVGSQIKNYFLREFEDKEDIEEMRKSISNVTIDEVIVFNNKLELKTIYLLKGDN